MRYPHNYPQILKRCSWCSDNGKSAGPLKKPLTYEQRGDDLLLPNAVWAFGGEALGSEVCEQLLKAYSLVYSETEAGWSWKVQDQLEFLRLSMDKMQLEKCKEVLAKVKAFYSRLS